MKQVKFYVREDDYEKLRKLAEEAGLSVSMLVKQAAFEKLNLGGGGPRSLSKLSELEERLRLLEKKYEQLGTEVGRIERDLIEIILRIEKIERLIIHSTSSQMELVKTLAERLTGKEQKSKEKRES